MVCEVIDKEFVLKEWMANLALDDAERLASLVTANVRHVIQDNTIRKYAVFDTSIQELESQKSRINDAKKLQLSKMRAAIRAVGGEGFRRLVADTLEAARKKALDNAVAAAREEGARAAAQATAAAFEEGARATAQDRGGSMLSRLLG